MISKKEWHAALRRVTQRISLIFGGVFMMAAMFYTIAWDLPGDAAIMLLISAVCIGYGMA